MASSPVCPVTRSDRMYGLIGSVQIRESDGKIGGRELGLPGWKRLPMSQLMSASALQP